MQHEQEQQKLRSELQQQGTERQALEQRLQQQDQAWMRLIGGIMRERAVLPRRLFALFLSLTKIRTGSGISSDFLCHMRRSLCMISSSFDTTLIAI